MNNQKILQKAIEKAENNGFPVGTVLMYRINTITVRDWTQGDQTQALALEKLLKDMAVMGLLTSHDFARAFFGDEDIITQGDALETVDSFFDDDNIEYEEIHTPSWKYHLMQMVISDDPIKYLEQYL